MKLIFAVLLVSVGVALADNTDIDWSKVEPLWQIKAWQDMHPTHMEIIRNSGLLEKSISYGPSGRIAGGSEAARHQFPYQAGIITHITQRNGFCGGSLVSINYVMTAAHCLDAAESIIAVVGAHNVFTQTEATQQRIFAPGTNFRIHDNWNAVNLLNDLAVVRLSTSVVYNDFVRSVRLPNLRQVDVTFVNQLGVVSGWGRTTNFNTDLSDTLQFARLPVITNLACRTRFPNSDILGQHICAGGDVGGPCTGDMGGPLSVVEADGRTTQVGVVSFGLGLGCEAAWPSVYLRTTTFLNWIETNTDGSIRENWD